MTNRSEGGDPGYSIGDLLSDAQVGFGPSLERIETRIYHNGRTAVAPKIDYLPADMVTPPEEFPPLEKDKTVRFKRKRKLLEIEHVATRVSPDEAFGVRRVTKDLFLRGFDDAIDAISWGLRTKIRPSDDFDTEACLAWVANIRDTTATLSETTLADRLEAARLRRRAHNDRLDPWEKLDIDWDEMHPKARTILDDPADWSCGDEFSPHGNDAGADLFADWPAVRRLSLAEAARRMELPPLSDDLPEYLWKEWVDTALGLAFGHIKKSGRCPARIAAETRDLLAREANLNKTRTKWPHRDDWQARLIRYDRILFDFDTRSE